MSPDALSARKFRFGVFQLDPASGELYKHGIRIKLQEQPFQVLVLLVQRPGELLTRDELRQRIWDQDTFVDFDHSLNISVNKLREALGDSASAPRFIETLPRRGYRFIAPVSIEEPPAAVVPSSTPNQATGGSPPPKRGLRPSYLWAGITAVAVIAFVLAFWLWPRGQQSSDPSRKIMLAVLPFENLTGDPHQDYFIAGLHDEMIAQLGRLHPSRLGVIARTSVAQYASVHKPVDQIARELHVDYILDGTVRSVGKNFRITAELIQVSDQTHLWTETYEPKLSNMLALQEDVSQRVSEALTVEFLPEAQQVMRRTATSNAEAYEAYLKGRYLWYQETRPALEESITQFQLATQLDPNYSPAYVGLADAYSVLGGYGFVPADQAFANAKAAANKALELTPDLSDAYGSLAFVAFYYDWDFPKAERLFRKALDLNPNNQVAHEFYSSFLHAMGRLDEAEAESRIAGQLDPLSGWIHDDHGWMLLSRRRPQDAIPEFQKAIELSPKFPAAHLSLAVAYSRTRQFEQALAEVQKAEEQGGDPTRVLEIRGSLQALAGDTAAAQATLDKLMNGKIAGRVSPYSVALIYTALGKKTEALDWLEKCYAEKDTWSVWLGVLVEWDSLRTEPRFINLLNRLNLQPTTTK